MRMTSLALALAAGLVAGSAVAQTPQTGTSTPTTRPPATAPAKPTAPTAPTPPTTTTPAAKLLDINTASKEELDALPGIGAARSEAIVKGRPYKSKDELVRKKIIPQGVYNGIKDRIVARQG